MKVKSLLLELAERCNSKTEKERRQLVHLTYENIMDKSHFIR
jgi:hypothetical protein